MKLTIKHGWTYTRKVTENKFLEVKFDHKRNWKSRIHHAEARGTQIPIWRETEFCLFISFKPGSSKLTE